MSEDRPSTPSRDATAVFLAQRPRLFALAYRMLGSVAEAEDLLQEAWLRWQAADRSAVAAPEAYLARVVTRLCLDHLKSARVRRERYVGPWLPEPLPGPQPGAEEALPGELAQELSVALLLALERLSPLERAVFLLHDVFEADFAEVAAALGRSEAACRQLAVRARAHVTAARPRFPVAPERAEALALAFHQAAREGDLAALQRLLAEEVVLYSDGGGRRAAALNPIHGRARVCRFFVGVARKFGGGRPPARFAWLNGQPGLLTLEADGLPQSVTLEFEGERIAAIYLLRNPEKLGHLAEAGRSA